MKWKYFKYKIPGSGGSQIAYYKYFGKRRFKMWYYSNEEKHWKRCTFSLSQVEKNDLLIPITEAELMLEML